MYNQVNAAGSSGRVEACVISSYNVYIQRKFLSVTWCRVAFIKGPDG